SLQGGAEKAHAAAGIKDAAHRQTDVCSHCRDQFTARVHLGAVGHRSTRVPVETLVVGAIKLLFHSFTIGVMSAPSPRVGFVSLGCPKALVDSERILTQLRIRGYEISPSY